MIEKTLMCLQFGIACHAAQPYNAVHVVIMTTPIDWIGKVQATEAALYRIVILTLHIRMLVIDMGAKLMLCAKSFGAEFAFV